MLPLSHLQNLEIEHDGLIQVHTFAPVILPFAFAGEELQHDSGNLAHALFLPVVAELLDATTDRAHRPFDE